MSQLDRIRSQASTEPDPQFTYAELRLRQQDGQHWLLLEKRDGSGVYIATFTRHVQAATAVWLAATIAESYDLELRVVESGGRLNPEFSSPFVKCRNPCNGPLDTICAACLVTAQEVNRDNPSVVNALQQEDALRCGV